MMNNKYFIAIFVNLAIPLGGMSTDIYLPSLPAMTNYFNSSNMLVQITVTLFTLGLGFGQVLAGPVSDAMGRKKPFLFGMFLQLVSIIFIMTTHSITALIIIRFFQGFGAALMMVPSRAMLNDVFDGVALKKQYTYITASFALGPIIAPFIGGYLQHYFGWKANFYFILCYVSILTGIALFVLKETISAKKVFSVAHVRSSYTNVLQNKLFVTGSILVGFFMAYVAIFNVIGPFLIQRVLGYSAVFYGYIALFMGSAWFLGNMTSRLFFHISRQTKSKVSFIIMIITSLIMLALSFTNLNILNLIIPTFTIIFFGGFLFPVYVGECLSIFRAEAASANGLLFSLVWIIFSFFSFVGAFLKVGTLTPIAICFLIITLFIYFWFLFVAKKH